MSTSSDTDLDKTGFDDYDDVISLDDVIKDDGVWLAEMFIVDLTDINKGRCCFVQPQCFGTYVYC